MPLRLITRQIFALTAPYAAGDARGFEDIFLRARRFSSAPFFAARSVCNDDDSSGLPSSAITAHFPSPSILLLLHSFRHTSFSCLLLLFLLHRRLISECGVYCFFFA